MARAAGPVEDQTGNADPRVLAGEAVNQRRDRMCLACAIDHQHHREFQDTGEIGRAAVPFEPRAIEKTHGPFDEEQPGARRQCFQPVGRHRPCVEIWAWHATGGGVKGGIDIVRAGFGPSDGMARASQGAKQR